MTYIGGTDKSKVPGSRGTTPGGSYFAQIVSRHQPGQPVALRCPPAVFSSFQHPDHVSSGDGQLILRLTGEHTGHMLVTSSTRTSPLITYALYIWRNDSVMVLELTN